MKKKLYKLTISSSSKSNEVWVVANDPTEAETKLLEAYRNYGYTLLDHVTSIILIADEGEYHKTKELIV